MKIKKADNFSIFAQMIEDDHTFSIGKIVASMKFRA
jgi:hypothetical protein